jgi:hypothetical protein
VKRCSDYEAKLARNKNVNDYYPDIAEVHKNELLKFFDSRNMEYLIKRKEAIKAISSRDEVLEHIRHVKSSFAECMGKIPQSDGIKAEIAGSLDKGAFTIEKVLIESIPGYYITANYYYPKNYSGKSPAILFLPGHSANGKAYSMYVAFCVEAVLNGFCVLTFDPVGQGERKFYNENDHEKFEDFSVVTAHEMAGWQISLTGENLTKYMMLDNIRALDYLCSRKEVDTSRIAVTGNSGGGQMSAFMGAYDDRLKVIAPCCYITEFKTMNYHIGAQDVEQSMPRFMEKGLDHSDLITAAAPKPYFVGAGLMDFFPIDGVRDAMVEARKMYRLLNAEDDLQIYVSPKPHGLWYDTREAVLRFLCGHLQVDYIESKDIDYENLPSEAELLCTPEGSVETYNTRTIRKIAADSLNKEPYVLSGFKNAKELEQFREAVKGSVLKLLGTNRTGEDSCAPLIEKTAVTKDSSGVITDIAFYSEQDMLVYCTLYESSCPGDKVLVHVGPLKRNFGKLSGLLKEYSTVLCVEPRGTGRGWLREGWNHFLMPGESSYNCNAAMLGESILGMKVLDVMQSMKLLKDIKGCEYSSMVLEGSEEHAVIALFTAAVEKLKGIRLENLLYSYESILESKVYDWSPSVFAYGLLKYFDIGDLLCAALPADIHIKGLLDSRKGKVGKDLAAKAFGKVYKAYGILNGTSILTIEE